MAMLLRGEELEREASRLGVDIEGDPITQSSSGAARRAPDHILQHRVAEAQRAIRESRLWILALVSAIASVISALTAIIAVTAS